MNGTLFILCALAVWRLTHLLSKEDGPFDLIYLLRKQLGQGFFGNLLDCFYCLSIWVALPAGIWLGETVAEKIISWFALSGLACLLEKISVKKEAEAPTYFEEDKK